MPPTIIITLGRSTTLGIPSPKPSTAPRSSTCQIVIAERRRTMVEKSRRQQTLD
jgi:hypothetical protein